MVGISGVVVKRGSTVYVLMSKATNQLTSHIFAATIYTLYIRNSLLTLLSYKFGSY